MRIPLMAALWTVAAAAEGTAPRPKPTDYPVHLGSPEAAVAAEFMVHSFGGQGATYIAGCCLTVEVALYPKPGRELKVDAGRFALRVNGRKQTLAPQAPGVVAGTIKFADWDRRGRLEAGAQAGNAEVVLGRPERVERFPGDPRARSPLPAPPRAPEAEDRSGLDRAQAAKPEEVVVAVALPEGAARGPVSGYLYFASKEKPARIKSLELLYDGVALKLR